MKEYQQIITDEKKDLDSKIGRLTVLIESEKFDSINPAEQVRMKQQRTIMKQYSDVLGARIQNFT